MKKLLATDIDGTLVIEREVTKETLKLIEGFKQGNNYFVLCTGRDFENTKAVFEHYTLPFDALILCNGALILNGEMKVLYEKSIPYEMVTEIYHAFKHKKDCYLSIGDGYKTYIDFEWEGLEDTTYKITKLSVEAIQQKFQDVKLMSLIVANSSIDEVEHIKDEINEKYGQAVVAYRNQIFIDIVPKGCSKATGIKRISEGLKVEDSQVSVIGDSWNDLSMFEHYQDSYTFHHAEEGLKKFTRYHVHSIEECLKKLQ